MLVWVILTTTAFSVLSIRRDTKLTALAKQGQQAHSALVALEQDLRARIADERASLARSEEFLRKHPDGIPGISAGLIKQGISALKRTIKGQLDTIAALDSALKGSDGSTST
jgi:hypothetical protein